MYLSCDKGNKKGVGHFCKVLSWWNPENGAVDTRVLDIDASGGKSSDCAAAVSASLNKLKKKPNDDSHRLSGQATNSGGGGVLDDLHKEM